MMNEAIKLIIADNEVHFEDGKKLFREYAASLPIDLAFQRFDEELDTVREQYGPPSGGLVLAYAGERAVGCAGVRNKGAGIAEDVRPARISRAPIGKVVAGPVRFNRKGFGIRKTPARYARQHDGRAQVIRVVWI